MPSLNQIRKNRKRVLGMNERYLEYIRPNNLSRSYEIADDKILTKQILQENEIPTPELLGTINSHQELDDFNFSSLPKSFALKPVHGRQGDGIYIFYNQDKQGRWISNDGKRYDIDFLKNHCRDILDGKYSLFNEPDTILIEERIRPHKAFRYHTYKGTPDVRVIVFNQMPVMAELRLPTEESRGKANMSAGGIGAGIDISVGKTTTANQGMSSDFIEYIPHTKVAISGLRIPYWNSLLENAVRAAEVTGLGYAGIDILIDRERGPVIIEVNARSGLGIQLANDDGIRRRLRKATGITVKSMKQGIRLAKDLFGGEIEENIEELSGKKVVGIYENVKIIGMNDKEREAKAKIDTGADSTSIDREIARELGYSEIIDRFDEIELPEEMDRKEGKELMKKYSDELVPQFEDLADVNLVHSSHGSSLRPYINIKMNLQGLEFETKATIYDRSKLNYPVIVGRKSLSKFLVDPSKNKKPAK